MGLANSTSFFTVGSRASEKTGTPYSHLFCLASWRALPPSFIRGITQPAERAQMSYHILHRPTAFPHVYTSHIALLILHYINCLPVFFTRLRMVERQDLAFII